MSFSGLERAADLGAAGRMLSNAGRNKRRMNNMLSIPMLAKRANSRIAPILLTSKEPSPTKVVRTASKVGNPILLRHTKAASPEVSKQILGETLVLTTFGLALGVFFAIQVPILDLFTSVSAGVYSLAIASAAAILYVIVTVCAVYPSRLAARIHPAVALHDD